MGLYTRIPADTFEQIQTDAGILLYNFDITQPTKVKEEDIICPTTGGITASCTPTYSDMGEDVDNCPANLLELKHLDSWECLLEFTSLGTTPKSIRLALGAADIDSKNPSKIIPRVSLKTSDASDIWWVGDRADDGMVAVCVKRALSTSGFSLQTSKNGKGQTSVTLTGHVSVATQQEVPMEFYSMPPKGASVPEQTASVGLGDKKVSDFITDDTALVWENDTDASVEGTLKYVKEFKEFSSVPDEQKGNYFPVKLADEYEGKEITVKKGENPEKTATETEWVLLIPNKETKVTFKEGDNVIMNLSFNDATLQRDEE